MIARRFMVHGNVQGVFFREWTIREATQLGVTGWVRNRSDGSVEVLAVGEPGAVETLGSRLKEGSSAARVERVEEFDAEVEEFGGFARRPTL